MNHMDTILVLNAGSNSLKFKLFRGNVELMSGHIDGIGKKGFCTVKQGSIQTTREHVTKDYFDAVSFALESVQQLSHTIRFVLHRVVHGGERFTQHCVIDNDVEKSIEELVLLAPLHNPANLAGIRAARKALPQATHVAFFDTAFHHTIPKQAFLYGLPYKLYEKWGIRKYGFHGLSHQYIAEEVYAHTRSSDRIISCHLGSGCSIAAVENGKCLDTTMGFTPLDGLLMATRSGELDPEIPLFLIENEHMTVKEVTDMLNKEAGMKGLIGTGDLREIKRMADEGNEMARLVIDMFCYRVAQAVGSYHVTVGGVHTLVFTGGIGEHADYVRDKVGEWLGSIGVLIDKHANKQHRNLISQRSSRVTTLIIPANEELQMVKLLLRGEYAQLR